MRAHENYWYSKISECLAYDQHSTSPSLIAIFWGNSSELQAGVARNATYLKIASPFYTKIARWLLTQYVCTCLNIYAPSTKYMHMR